MSLITLQYFFHQQLVYFVGILMFPLREQGSKQEERKKNKDKYSVEAVAVILLGRYSVYDTFDVHLVKADDM